MLPRTDVRRPQYRCARAAHGRPARHLAQVGAALPDPAARPDRGRPAPLFGARRRARRVAARAARRGLPDRRGGVAPRHRSASSRRGRRAITWRRSSTRSSAARRRRSACGSTSPSRCSVSTRRSRRSSVRCSRRSASAGRAGELSVAEEHLVSEAVRSRLGHLLGDPGGGVRGIAVLACAPGERHELGLMMAAIALRRDGWKVVYLGADTPLGRCRRAGAAPVGPDARAQPCACASMRRRSSRLWRRRRSRKASALVLGGSGSSAALARRLGGTCMRGRSFAARSRPFAFAHGVACRHDPALHRRPLVARSRVRARGRGLDRDRRLAVLVALRERVPRARRAARRAERDARGGRRRGGRSGGNACRRRLPTIAQHFDLDLYVYGAGGHLLAKAPARTQFAPAPAEQAGALRAASSRTRGARS